MSKLADWSQEIHYRFSSFVSETRLVVVTSWIGDCCNWAWHIKKAAVVLSINSIILILFSGCKASTHKHTHTHTHTHTKSVPTYAWIHPKHTMKGYFLLVFSEKLYSTSDKQGLQGKIFSHFFEDKSAERIYSKGCFFFPFSIRMTGGIVSWGNCLAEKRNIKESCFFYFSFLLFTKLWNWFLPRVLKISGSGVQTQTDSLICLF